MSELSLRKYLEFENVANLSVRQCVSPVMGTISLRVLLNSTSSNPSSPTSIPALPLRIIHISDPHFTSSPRVIDLDFISFTQNSTLRSKVLSNYLIDKKAEFNTNKIIITGDLTDSGDEADYVIAQEFIHKLEENGFVVYSIPGNHDYSKLGNLILGQQEIGHSETRQDNFIKYCSHYSGSYPRYVDLGSAWLVLLDSMEGEIAIPDHNTPLGTEPFAHGRLGANQLNSLEKWLNASQRGTDRKVGKKIVLCLHHSPLITTKGTTWKDRGVLFDVDQFTEIITNKIDCLLFGHTTPQGVLQQSFKEKFGVPLINCENLEHIAWFGEQRLGSKIDTALNIAVGQNADGRLEIFYVGTNFGIYHNWQNEANGAWHGEERLGGLTDFARKICVGRNLDGRLEVFYIGGGPDPRTPPFIYHNWQDKPNGSWHGEQRFNVSDTALQIAVGQNADGRLEIFYVGTNFGIYHNWQKPNGGWSGEANLGGQAIQLCIGQNADGRIELFYLAPDLSIYHNWQKPGGWSGGKPLGGQATQISVGRNQDGRLEIFYIGTNGKIYHNWQTTAGSDNWNGERMLGEPSDGAIQICVGENKDGHLEVFYIGNNLVLYHNFQTTPNGVWAGELQLSGILDRANQICVGKNEDGRLELFYIGTNLGIFHNWQTISDTAYPIVVADLGNNKIELYFTDYLLHNNKEPGAENMT